MPLPLPTQAAQLEERLASSSALRELSYKADLEKRLTAFLAQPRGQSAATHVATPCHHRERPRWPRGVSWAREKSPRRLDAEERG